MSKPCLFCGWIRLVGEKKGLSKGFSYERVINVSYSDYLDFVLERPKWSGRVDFARIMELQSVGMASEWDLLESLLGRQADTVFASEVWSLDRGLRGLE